MKENRFRIEWGLSLINKYGIIIIEEALESYKITKTQGLFIMHIGHNKTIYQDRLAHIFKMNRSTATRALRDLKSKDLITSRVDQDNKKANIISLTDEGYLCSSAIFVAIEQWINVLTDGFDEEEIQLCESLIVRMSANACKHLGDEDLARLISK